MSDVTEKMFSAVSEAKSNVKRAEQAFNERSRAIRIMAMATVDLNNFQRMGDIDAIFENV